MHTIPPVAPSRSPRQPTIEDWLAIPEEQRAEFINGRIVYQGMPGPMHGRTQGAIIALVRGAYDRRPGSGDRPGGWWISMEVDMEIAGLGCRPDVLGWRRDKHTTLPEPDRRGIVTVGPDWICEVLSPTTAHIDMGDKRLGYHRAGVAHYWMADPHNGTLAVLRWTAEGYLIELVAGRGDRVRAAPFDAVEIEIDELFGDVSAASSPVLGEEAGQRDAPR
ncbi:Uma2 family endonuclease [Sorangium sp. So ce1099]|uniref:Uma2 family endonuclease n=1 Tax=Sorangium sp. So ce1099 TaxID=3133331 RepID=UPI003F5F9193